MALLLEITPDALRKRINTWRFRTFQLGKASSRSSIAAFDYYKCIFVHIPKTGGISVNEALWGNPGGVHRTMEQYARIFSPETLDDYFKFTFVRNPWDRLVSAYTFLKAGGQHSGDRRWAQKHLAGLDDFDRFVHEWINSDNVHKGIHFKPQVEFLKHNGRIEMDLIGKLEHMERDFEIVKERLGLPDAALPHRNRSVRRDFHEYYTPETREIVASVYREDIEALDYTFDE